MEESKMFNIGQRQVTALVFVLVTLGAAILGKTPDSFLELITGLIAPLTAVGAVFIYLVQTIQARVNNPDDPFEPGDLLQLFKSAEFVTALVVAVLGLLPMIGVQIGDGQKDAIINLVLAVMSLLVGVPLMKSYRDRASTQFAPEPE
jgi:uncharacterized membrane protein YqaE (UPF0057 family)